MDDWTLCEPDDKTAKFCFEERFLALYEFQCQGWLCDVEIACDDGEVSAHKVVLAASSTYFKRMFSSSMMESTSPTMSMPGICRETLCCIVKYLYTNTLDVTKDTALDVLKVANLLCLRQVERTCFEMLLGPISTDTALDYAVLSERYGISDLISDSLKFLVKDIKGYVEDGTLNKLDIVAFTKLIESDDLDVCEEAEVFEIVLKWVKAEPASRLEHFHALLEHVRLPLISPGYLVDVVERSDYVRGSLACRDLVDEAKNRHLLPKRIQGYLTERMTPRKSTVGYIFLIGGLTVKEKQLCSVERYDLPLQQSFAMPEMGLARSGLGAAILKKVLYVIGGHDGTKPLKIGEALDFGKGSWTWIQQLKVPRRNLGVCTDDIRLFAVGGQIDSTTTLETMEVFDPREGIWRYFPSMKQARKYANVACFNNSIYIVGGNNGSQYLQQCERFDLRACCWDKVAPLPCCFGANGLSVWNEQLVTVGGFDSKKCLEVSYAYDHVSDSWSSLEAEMSTKRTGLGAVTAGHRLYALGGHSGETYLNSVEMYDPKMHSWTSLSPLHYRRGAMGVAVLENCYMTQTDPL